MEARNFNDDLRNSETPEIREAWLKILKKKFGEDIEVQWKDQLVIQKGLGTDITIKTKKGRRYSIELKTRKHTAFNKNWVMEIINHVYDKEDKKTRTKLKSYDGWIYTTTAEYLFHGTLNKNRTDFLEVISYSLMPFKNEIWKSEFAKYKSFFWPTRFPDGKFQWSVNKEIPKEVIKKEALEFWEWTK